MAVRLHGGVSGGGDALGGLSSSAVGGSATLSGNTVAVLIGGEMDVRRGRDGNPVVGGRPTSKEQAVGKM